MKRAAWVLLVLVLAAGCSGDDGRGGGTPKCTEVFADGAKAEEPKDACTADDGKLSFVGTASTDCDDGRKLLWNDYAWGFEGDVWHTYDQGDEQVAPESERNECSGG